MAGSAIRFAPGETREVALVEIDGRRVIRGGNRLASGPVSDEGLAAALENIRTRAYATTTEK